MPQNINIKIEETVPESYDPKGEELEVQEYLKKRIPILKDTKKNILGGINYEKIMEDADREYQPHRLTKGENEDGGYVFVYDEEIGVRGGARIVKTRNESESWRSNVSEPTLLTKINTALSILIDKNPEAVFKATAERYKATTALTQARWKKSWDVGKAKKQLKLFIFDLAKYGFAIGRTYPRLVQRNGEILEEINVTNPEKNKYQKTTITEFNGVLREKLDPYRTWIDDMTNLTDPWSMDDWYFEKDYSYDSLEREFGNYDNFDKIPKSARVEMETEKKNQEIKERMDIVTLGFYESKNKDLYAIYVPTLDVVLYHSPLPNDEKRLSCWWTYWNERDPRTPYGIGLYEILKNNKVLYDRLKNMTVDQLVMAIYPMLFYSGQGKGTGDMTISPGILKQKLPGTTIDQVNVHYDPRGWEGVRNIAEQMDEDTGISHTLQGEVTGKTLGEVLHAKDAALKRLNIPLNNIAEALEDEAYISLSWDAQISSIPEVKQFSDADEYNAYLQETGKQSSRMLIGENGVISADFLPMVEFSLEQNKEGILIENPKDRFFQIGRDIPVSSLRWEGIIKVIPQSILVPSKEIERQRKMELFNLVMPIIEILSQASQLAPFYIKPLRQVLESQDEKLENWLPKNIIELADNPIASTAGVEQQPLFKDSSNFSNDGGDTVVSRKQVTNPMRDILSSLKAGTNRTPA